MRNYDDVFGQIELFSMFVVSMIHNHGNIDNSSNALNRIKLGWHGIYNPNNMYYIACNGAIKYVYCTMRDIDFEIVIPSDYDYRNVRINYRD